MRRYWGLCRRLSSRRTKLIDLSKIFIYSIPHIPRDKMVVDVDEDACIACGQCEPECPVEAITVEEVAIIDEETCIDCGNCIEVCPVDALSL